MSVFSQRTLWCHVCISNENLWFNTCIELSKTRQHPLCCCEAEVSCVQVCDPLWLYPHSRQQAHFNTFLRNTWHRPFVGPFTEHYKTINTNYHSTPSVAHCESNTTHLSFCSSHYNMCKAWRPINLNSDSGSNSALLRWEVVFKGIRRLIAQHSSASRLHYLAHQQVRWHARKMHVTSHFTPVNARLASQWLFSEGVAQNLLFVGHWKVMFSLS